MRFILVLLLIAAAGCSGDSADSESSRSFCAATEDLRAGLEELDPPDVGFPITAEDRQVMIEYNQEVSRLAEPLKDLWPSELQDAGDLIADVDLTDPDATSAPDYQDALNDMAAYVESECGIETELDVP